MGQFLRALAVVVFIALQGCDQPRQSASSPPARHPTIASMVPAATDILIMIGARDHLVAVSNYDTANPAAANLPRVGDYQTTDWEKLASLKPDILLIQMNEASVPPGLKSRAADLGAKLVNVRINTLPEIQSAITQLGQVANEPDKASAALADLNSRLEKIHAAAPSPPVPTMIILDDTGKGVVGPGGFLDDLLTLAGGKNVAAELGKPYATVDPERIAAMNPSVIIQLLPNFSPDQIARTERAWANLPNVTAVKEHRIYTITDWYALLPSPHVADLAEQFSRAVHSPTTQAAK
jgi:iron complex transport system substrate-binding protein